MLMLLVIASMLAAVHADCDACIKHRCHSKKILIEGFQVTNQLAIDRTDNILYVQLDHHTTAFFLNESKMRNVHSENTKGLAVDQETQILYSSLNNIIFTYRYEEGKYTRKAQLYLPPSQTPVRLRYEDTLYTVNEDGSSGYYSKISNSFTGYDNLENFPVTDLANVRDITNWFFVSGNKLYKLILDYNTNGIISWHRVSDKNHVLAIGKSGDVYFGSTSEKVIYKLNRETKELLEYAVYIGAQVKDFVFDRDENIVFHDADGSVAIWVPSKKHCEAPFRPPVKQEDPVAETYWSGER